jgi:hypothetical protein
VRFNYKQLIRLIINISAHHIRSLNARCASEVYSSGVDSFIDLIFVESLCCPLAGELWILGMMIRRMVSVAVFPLPAL